MSEEILKAIIELLAIVAREDDVTLEEKGAILYFLMDNLGKEDANRYYKYFESLAKESAKKEEHPIESEKAEINQICTQINQALTQPQKLIILLKLLELITADGKITQRENDLVYYITEKINLQTKTTDLIKAFVIYQERSKVISTNILIIDDGKLEVPERCKRILAPHLNGFIFILRVPDADIYFGKYIGEDPVSLNGVQMNTNQVYTIPSGAVIKSENNPPVFFSEIVSCFMAEDRRETISFVADHIEFQFRNGNIGLRDINIYEEGGKLIAIMGGSGSGKSTLLNVLNGNDSPNHGEVRINGINIHQYPQKIEGLIGYIPQDDLLIEELTVFENLFYAGKLCFKDKNDHEISAMVDKLLDSLGLKKASQLRVGSPLEKSISGGQRKRLNIGLELIREPSVLFVDEPTSGLSSRDSENIMELLKELSLKGKMIFVVIHQPSEDIYKMFDKLILLDVGGYQIYYGNPVEAINYFNEIAQVLTKRTSINPEQIFNIIEAKVINEYGQFTSQRKVQPVEWSEIYKSKEKKITVSESHSLPKSELHIPNRFSQWKIFCSRDIKSKLSNKQYLWVNLLEAPLLAVLLTFIIRYFPDQQDSYTFRSNQNIPVFFFMSVIVALFMGLTVSAEEIIRDRKILKREAFLHLSRLGYLSSKTSILLFISLVQTLTFVLISHWILEIKGMTLASWMILFTVSSFANILGLNVSSAFKSAVTVYVLIPLLIIPQLILSGVVVNFDKLNPILSNEEKVPLIGEIMASRWAYEALAVYQYTQNNYMRPMYEVEATINQSQYKTIYHLPWLKAAVEFAKQNKDAQEPEVVKDIKNKILLVKNELEEELISIGKDKFPEIDQLSDGKMNDELYEKTLVFIEKLKAYYNLKSKKANIEKEAYLNQFNANEQTRMTYNELRDTYDNEANASLVKNSNTDIRVAVHGHKLIQKLYPIYSPNMSPDNFLDFRAQFYTPSKYFAGQYFPTWLFNTFIIWVMSLTLFITLYFDLLKKLISSNNKKPGK